MDGNNSVYLLELGVLLPEGHGEYDAYRSYDKEHAFYDESQEYRILSDRESIIKEALDYVNSGVPNTYAVLSETVLDDDALDDVKNGEQVDVEYEDYAPEDVVFSVYKDDSGHFYYDFIEGQQLTPELKKFAEEYVEKLCREADYER